MAEVEWHWGELYPRVSLLVTNVKRPPERVVRFYNGCGTAEQWMREGKLALRWIRLSCRAFRANAVRLQQFALAYNPDFLRTIALPDEVAQWTLTTLARGWSRSPRGSRPRPLRGLPAGRGGGTAGPVRGDPASGSTGCAAARAGDMTGAQ